jgi:hypothetical protein
MFGKLIAAQALASALAASLFVADGQAQSAGNYARDESWLCRPERTDACAANQDATIVAVDGALTLEAFHADPTAPIDCFYVYPTVSNEPTGNADLVIGPEQRSAPRSNSLRVLAPRAGSMRRCTDR